MPVTSAGDTRRMSREACLHVVSLSLLGGVPPLSFDCWKKEKMMAATIRVTMFPEGRVVDTKLSQITSGSLLTCGIGVLFRHYDNGSDCYMWTSNDGDRFTDDDLQGLLVERGEVPVVMRYR